MNKWEERIYCFIIGFAVCYLLQIVYVNIGYTKWFYNNF